MNINRDKLEPLTISKKQKERLLELCKFLFPEFKSIDFVESCDFCLVGTMRFSKYEKPGDYWNKWLLIHWTELCQFHIPLRLFNHHDVLSSINNRPLFDETEGLHEMAKEQEWSTVHIVDYLYERYLTIKK